MKSLNHYYWSLISRIRDWTNPYIGPIRRKRLKTTDITIISNNCWGGHFYRGFQIPYDSPTIGLYIFPQDYLKMCYQLKYYMSLDLQFITIEQSKYKELLFERNEQHVPIGLLGDVEIIFLHYHSKEEAYEKWNRRKNRIHWDNIYFKFSQMNGCCEEDLIAFDNLPTEKKFVFTSTKRSDLQSAICMNDFINNDQIMIDTMNFKPNLNLVKLINSDGKNYR